MALPRSPSLAPARPSLGRVLGGALLAAIAVVPGLVGARPAAAQTGCRAGSGLETAEISIDEPAANSTVTERDIRVRGKATAALGTLNRVEVTVAGVTKPSQFAPSGSLGFNVPFDLSGVSPGPVSVRVVACGTGNLTGVLAGGVHEMRFTLQAPAPATTTPPTTAGSTPGSTVSSGGSTGGVVSATTTAPVATTRPGQASSTTTPTSTPPTTEEAASQVADERPEPVRPTPGRSDGPLVLTEADDDGSSGPPLWVGAVVGVSGGLGLLFSAASSRRRTRQAGQPVEPVDPDLVDVR